MFKCHSSFRKFFVITIVKRDPIILVHRRTYYVHTNIQVIFRNVGMQRSLSAADWIITKIWSMMA